MAPGWIFGDLGESSLPHRPGNEPGSHFSAAGAVTCRARELGMGDAPWGPRARGERRRHTITNGVDCDLVSRGPGELHHLSWVWTWPPHSWFPRPFLCLGGDPVAGMFAVLNLSSHPGFEPTWELAHGQVKKSFGQPLPGTVLAPTCFPGTSGQPTR